MGSRFAARCDGHHSPADFRRAANPCPAREAIRRVRDDCRRLAHDARENCAMNKASHADAQSVTAITLRSAAMTYLSPVTPAGVPTQTGETHVEEACHVACRRPRAS